MPEDIYCGTGKLIEFKSGGTMVKIAFSERDLENMRAYMADGWVRVNIMQRKQASDKGQTHYGKIDLWKPERKAEPPPVPPLTQNPVDKPDDTQEQMPF